MTLALRTALLGDDGMEAWGALEVASSPASALLMALMEKREGSRDPATGWGIFSASSSLLVWQLRPWPPAPLRGGRPPAAGPWHPALLEGETPPDLLRLASVGDSENRIRLLGVLPLLLALGELPSLLRLRLKRERPPPGEGVSEMPGLELLDLLGILVPPPGSPAEMFPWTRLCSRLSDLGCSGISSSPSMSGQFSEFRLGPSCLDGT